MRGPLTAGAAPLFFTLGLLAVAWAVLAYRSQRRFLSNALRATGVVEGLKTERMERSTVYFPILRFTTAAGATVIATSKSSKSSGYPIGQNVSILYDPDDPSNVEIDAFWSRWFFVIGATFVALLFFGIGASALLNRPG